MGKKKVILVVLLFTLLSRLVISSINATAMNQPITTTNVTKTKPKESHDTPWWLLCLMAGSAGWMFYVYKKEKDNDE